MVTLLLVYQTKDFKYSLFVSAPGPTQATAWDNLTSPTTPTAATFDAADDISGFSDLGIFEKNSEVVEQALHYDQDGLGFEAIAEAKTDESNPGVVHQDNGAEPEQGRFV